MSEQDRARDRLIIAHIAGVAGRHCPLSGCYPRGEDAAIAEVREAAAGRADLLCEHAGMSLGLSLTEAVDQISARLVAEAGLCARAGADLGDLNSWIDAGLLRGEQINASRRRSGA